MHEKITTQSNVKCQDDFTSSDWTMAACEENDLKPSAGRSKGCKPARLVRRKWWEYRFQVSGRKRTSISRCGTRR